MAGDAPRWRVHEDAEPAPPASQRGPLLRSAVGMLLAVCGPLVAAAGLVTLLSSDTGGLRLVPIVLVGIGALATVVGTRTMLAASRARVRSEGVRRPERPQGRG